MSAEATGFVHFELAEIRRSSLLVAAFLTCGVGYTWLLFTVWPETGGPSPASASWCGGTVAIMSALAALKLRHRYLTAASCVLVIGVLVGVACAVFLLGPAHSFLFIIPIAVASVFLERSAFYAVVSVVVGLVVIRVFHHVGNASEGAGTSAGSTTVGTALATVAVASAASWLSAHRFQIALRATCIGYERARQNSELARTRQGEVSRALKSLEEASYRLTRSNYELGLARARAEEARQMKQRFAQNVSHELRTPLNSIIGFTELMTEAPEYYGAKLPPSYLRDLNIVYRNACHLQDLINDILDLSRVDAAQMQLATEDVSPIDVVHQASEMLRSLIEARGLELSVHMEIGAEKYWMDPTRIRQVLINLLSNAARFTDDGGISLRVCRSNDELLFSVADTGIGIGPKEIDRVFEEFHQSDGSRSGTGLGLAISKRFVEMHGGRIWVDSTLGEGTTFSFSIPGRHGADGPITSISSVGLSERSVVVSRMPVVLVVTRSPAAASLLTGHRCRFRAIVVSDLAQAAKVARYEIPQLIVVDQALDESDTSGLSRLPAQWGLPESPIVCCSLPSDERLRSSFAVDAYLAKPVSVHDLWDVLRRFGGGVETILVIDDDIDFICLLGRMLRDSPVRPYRVVSAMNGREGLMKLDLYHPDLVLLDLGMPGMDGYQVLEQVRSQDAWRDLPIVVVSGQDRVDEQERMGGAVTFAKSQGMLPGELLRWLDAVLATCAPSSSVTPE